MPSANLDQLRADIDRGRTGDKVEGSDPAAAPLGADEEAAGTPVPEHAVTAARNIEVSRHTHTPRKKSGLGAAWTLVCFVLVLAVGITSWMLWQ